MQVDDVTRNEAVVPSASLHAYGVIEGHRLKMCRGTDFDRKPARLKRLLEKIDLEFVLPHRQPEAEPCPPDTPLHRCAPRIPMPRRLPGPVQQPLATACCWRWRSPGPVMAGRGSREHGTRTRRPAGAGTSRKSASRPALPGDDRPEGPAASQLAGNDELPFPFTPGVRPDQAPQSRPHFQQQPAMNETLKVIALGFSQEQRIHRQPVLLIRHVVDALP